MPVSCIALKAFDLYRDGVTREPVQTNAKVDVPDNMVAGLETEKYVKVAGKTKAAVASPETKVIRAAPETKAD